MVRKVCKADPAKRSKKHGGFKWGKVWKGNAKDAGRPLWRVVELDSNNECDLHLPVSVLALQK